MARVAGWTDWLDGHGGRAGATDAIEGAVPAVRVLAGGVLADIPDADVERTFSAPAVPLRGRHGRVDPPPRGAGPLLDDPGWASDSGFAERSFDSPGVGDDAVGSRVLVGPARRLEPRRVLA
ncbi:MAG: hypothetical protein B7Z69_04025 [Actinobacteria bacterium 21-73-9]|nr:MAG: hypothetical protein B7Z69_04025 [Actinobacteria bacterium 21-73-9]